MCIRPSPKEKNKAFLFCHCCSVLYEWQLQGRTDLVSVWDDKSMKDQCQTREDKWSTSVLSIWFSADREDNTIQSALRMQEKEKPFISLCPRFLSTSTLCQWVQVKGFQWSVEPPSGLSGWLINSLSAQCQTSESYFILFVKNLHVIHLSNFST